MSPDRIPTKDLALEILGDLDDGIAVLDSAFRIVYANAAAKRITGQTTDVLPGKTMWEVLPADLGTGIEAAFRRALDEQARIRVPYLHPPSNKRYDVSVRPLDHGRLCVSFRDAGDGAADEATLPARCAESVARFAAGVAHNLNNILTPVSGHVSLALRKMPPQDPLLHHVGAIRDGTARAAELARQLLAIGGKQFLRPRAVDLNAAINGMQETVRHLAGGGIDLVLRLGAGLSPIQADPQQIEHLLANLAANAREAMPHGGHLLIETAVDGRDAMLVVGDTGAGLDEHARPRIFEPFANAVGPGRGLTLAAVYGIVRQSGGRVSVDSAAGQGTVFRIRFPFAASAECGTAGPDAGRAALPPSERERLSVLVADDDDSVRNFLAEVLSDAGYQVTLAADGAAVLAVVDAHPIDLVITDLMMPGQDGFDIIRALHRSRSGVKIIGMSGAPALRSVGESGWKLLGAHAVLEKPVHLVDLLAAVEQLLAPGP